MFPSTYYTGERILKMTGDTHRVFVAAEDQHILGFVIVEISKNMESAEIQFLGVRPENQGKGIGRDLLLSAAHWLFKQPAMTEVSLNVRQELTMARTLYEKSGFELRYAGIALRKKLLL
jgi:ribosomal protein S18 acetylase RimI-like enzyme